MAIQIAPLNLAVVFVRILDAKVRDGNSSSHTFQVIPFGNFLPHSVAVPALICGRSRETGVELPFHFVIELHTKDSATAAFDFIANLVIKPVEVGVMEGFLGFLESV